MSSPFTSFNLSNTTSCSTVFLLTTSYSIIVSIICKFASFVVSTTNTVFYSTKANDGTSGFIGISKLRSAPIPGEDENLLTIGVGYYAETERNLPVQHELHLDKNFIRNEKQYGTDVYIIGFNNFKGWQYDIIAKVLESFMIAVMRGELEVIVDGITVNQNTVKEIVYDEDFQKGRGKKECEKSACLIVKYYGKGYEDEVIRKIEKAGYDPEDYQIIYERRAQ